MREDLATAPRDKPEEVAARHDKRLDDIRGAQARVARDLREAGQRSASRISSLYSRLRLEVSLIEASMNFGHTGSTSLITGWVDASSVAGASRRLLEETGGRLVLQVRDPEGTGTPSAEVPTLLRHSAFVRPFQLLLTGFGIPAYQEIEPTLLMGISFLVLYGIMFGDMAHGLLLAAIGWGIRWKSRDEAMRDLAMIIIYAGLAATVGGVLYGSAFGKEGVLPPLWLAPMSPEHPGNILKILAYPVGFGVLLLSVGVILNIVNRFRFADYGEAVFGHFGLLGLLFYWGSLGVAVTAGLGTRMTPVAAAAVIVLPLLVFAGREVFHCLHSAEGEAKPNLFTLLIHSAVGIMEVVSTYLANTFSFARVGAFALAHAGLCIAIFALQDIVRGLPGGIVWSAIIFVLGTALVLLLEGLIVFVQCLRLEYYEFLGKFFAGTGKRFSPFRIG
jgi:V/A-type H+-transporting ATPase subunit I